MFSQGTACKVISESPSGAIARGWIKLGAWDVANDELEQITPELRAHPTVLKVRFNIYLAAKHFELATAAADGLVEMLPEDPEGWIHRSYALHEMKRTAEAQAKLRPAAEKFPNDWRVQYNMACYACQLGEMDEARAFLERAIELGDGEQVKLKARVDPDLSALFDAAE